MSETWRPGDNDMEWLVQYTFDIAQALEQLPTLRDFFAGCALMGFSANPAYGKWTVEDTATTAYEQADAMIQERGGGESE